MAQTSLSHFNSVVPPQLPAGAYDCPYPHHGDTTVNDDGRVPKRRRPGSYLQADSTTPFMVTAYAATLEDFQPTEYGGFEQYANSDTNILGQAPYKSSPFQPSGIQNYFGFDSAYSLQQGSASSHDDRLISTTYTTTSHTLSPSSFERPLSADPQNSTTLSQGDGTEHGFVDLDFDVGDFEWLYNESEGCVVGPGGAGRLLLIIPSPIQI